MALALRRILAHVIAEQFLDTLVIAQDHRLESDIVANEAGKLFRRYLTQSLETGDLRLCAQFLDGPLAFLIGVAIDRLLFVPHPEKRRIQYMQVVIADQVGEELQEEGE